MTTFWDGLEPATATGVHTTRLTVSDLPIAKGTYSATAYLFDSSGLHIWDQAVVTKALTPASAEWAPALLEVHHRWQL